MMTRSETRQALYATMRRFTAIVRAWHPHKLAAFVGTDAYHDYRMMEETAAVEREPVALARLVTEMNDLLDGIEKDAA